MKAMGCLNDCNIAFTKTWIDNVDQDDTPIEIAIDVWTRHGYMHQIFYTTSIIFEEFGRKMTDKSYQLDDQLDIEFKESGFHPAVLFRFLSADFHGVIPIEVDLQVLDNPDESARCRMRVEIEAGMLERFGKAVQRVAHGAVGEACRLNPSLPARCIPGDTEEY